MNLDNKNEKLQNQNIDGLLPKIEMRSGNKHQISDRNRTISKRENSKVKPKSRKHEISTKIVITLRSKT